MYARAVPVEECTNVWTSDVSQPVRLRVLDGDAKPPITVHEAFTRTLRKLPDHVALRIAFFI